MNDIMSVSIRWDTLIDEFSVFVDHHVLHVQKPMEFLCVFRHGFHKAFLLHFICNCKYFGTSCCLVAILSQEVDPSNYRVILIISRNQFFECRVFEIICEFLNLAFLNESKLPIFGHSWVYNVFRGKDDFLHDMCQFRQGLSLEFLHYLILF